MDKNLVKDLVTTVAAASAVGVGIAVVGNEYTFSEAAENMVNFLKLMGYLDKDFKLPDPAKCLIDELDRKKKLLDESNKLQKEHEEQTKKYAKAISGHNELLVKNNDLEGDNRFHFNTK